MTYRAAEIQQGSARSAMPAFLTAVLTALGAGTGMRSCNSVPLRVCREHFLHCSELITALTRARAPVGLQRDGGGGSEHCV